MARINRKAVPKSRIEAENAPIPAEALTKDAPTYQIILPISSIGFA
jgi:hypothetical protein